MSTSSSALEAVFAECDAGLAGAIPKAGLLMSAWEVDHQDAIDRVRARYPGIELAGSSSAGEMSSVLGFREDSVALALFASDTIDIVVGLGRDLVADPLAAARRAVDGGHRQDDAPATSVHRAVDDRRRGGERDPRCPPDRARPRRPDHRRRRGRRATRAPKPTARPASSSPATSLTGDALAILLFAGPLAFSFGVETGWRGVGPRATVTRTSDAGVLEIDGRPALEFYERYLGTGQPPVANPLAVFEEPGSDRFYLRTPMAYDRDRGSISFFGAVPEGASVQLTMAGTDEIFEGTRASIADALAGLPARRPARRRPALLLRDAQVPAGDARRPRDRAGARDPRGRACRSAGSTAMGEIAPMASADLTRFHNATMVSVLLGSASADGAGPA